jgi:peptide/nickel transport system substrate-binding protein
VNNQAAYNLSEYEKATNSKINSFRQSPILDVDVSSGRLPRVQDRLPEDPVVLVPYSEIGEYGGTITIPALEPKSWWPASQGTTEYFFTRDMRYPDVLLPSIATGYVFSSDYKSLTISLRKGLKWSDGAPFTADDIMFWWEIVNNKDLYPTLSAVWAPGGTPMTVTKVDDFTVRYDFSIPNSTVIYYFCQWGNQGMQGRIFLPRHALEKYLPQNNPGLENEARAAGFNNWMEYFLDFASFDRDSPQKIDFPYMGPWIPQTITNDYITWKRNPYYFKLDPEGKQLPYIDTYRGIFYRDADTLKLRTLAGDYDYVPFGLSVADQTVIAENAANGNYYIIQTPGVYGADCAIFINLDYKSGKEEGAILADKRFRQALSVAIDREEMNTIINRGLGRVTQATVDFNSKWFKQSYADAYAQYDPALANRLLDEMGMNRRDSAGFRMTPDGRQFTLVPEFSQTPAAVAQSGELIKDYWEKVGIRTNMRILEYSNIGARRDVNEVMIFGYPLDGVDSVTQRMQTNIFGGANGGWNFLLSQRWMDTNGAEGEEPTNPDIKRFLQTFRDKSALSDEAFDRAMTEALDWCAENVPTIGTFGFVPAPTVVRNGLGNVDAVNVFGFSHPADGTKSHRPEVFFWKDASKRR